MLLELSETPFSGTGNPEALKWELTGYWSRRINQKDRLIYKVAEELVIVYVVSASGHYEDLYINPTSQCKLGFFMPFFYSSQAPRHSQLQRLPR